jgi:hypothetical protein
VSAATVRRRLAFAIMSAAIMSVSLGMQGPASAAASRTAKLKLVAFKASPFPYEGLPPGRDKPFFDTEKDGRRGHTARGGNIYWEDTTYSDRRALLFIPKGFDPARPGLIVVYFHGNQAALERDVWRRQQVPRQVAQSGLNAVLVAPQFAVDALDSSAGQFWEPGAFRRYLEEAAEHLARLSGNPWGSAQFDALGVVIVAYSGGYFPTAWAMHHGGVGDRLRGVIMLDALYGEFDTYLRWIEKRESAFFLSAYSRSVREENASFQKLLAERNIDFATAMPGKLAPGSVTFLATGEEVAHNDFVTKAWVDDPLKEVLAKIQGFPRTPPPKPMQRR